MPKLRGKLVYLDTMEREHCRALWKAEEGTGPPPTQRIILGLSIEGADRWFDEIQAKQNKEHVYLGVFLPDGNIIGDIQIANIDLMERTATLGLGFAAAEHRGKGYGTDAAITILHHAFLDLDLRRVSAKVVEFNTAGIRSLEKVGFIHEGRERKSCYAGGRRWDRLLYGILREEYMARYGEEGAP